MITSLYAGGMTVRDIERHLAGTLGLDLPPATISAITDAMLKEVKTGSPGRWIRSGRSSTSTRWS